MPIGNVFLKILLSLVCVYLLEYWFYFSLFIFLLVLKQGFRKINLVQGQTLTAGKLLQYWRFKFRVGPLTVPQPASWPTFRSLPFFFCFFLITSVMSSRLGLSVSDGEVSRCSLPSYKHCFTCLTHSPVCSCPVVFYSDTMQVKLSVLNFKKWVYKRHSLD